jgi:3-oxoacyl-[acyl-carrier protein] reductase
MTTAPAPSPTRRSRDRVALVTGGGGAIGSAIALRLAAEGVAVAVNDIDPAAAELVAADVESRTGTRALPVPADITDRAAVTAMAAAVADGLGPVGILVNNAGILRNARLEDLDDTRWQTVLDVHLRGAYLCTQAVVGQMKDVGWGRIVSLSSAAARGSDRGHTNYSTVKAGLIGMTRSFAIELGPAGITANAVAPGAIRSDMTEATARQIDISFAEYEDQVSASNPRRRIGEPADIANAVAFFAAEESDYVNGQVLYVTGAP